MNPGGEQDLQGYVHDSARRLNTAGDILSTQQSILARKKINQIIASYILVSSYRTFRLHDLYPICHSFSSTIG